jgi:hypothetical protein
LFKILHDIANSQRITVGCKIEHPLNIVRCLYNLKKKFKFKKYVSYFKIQGEFTWISIAGAKDAATSGAGL